MTEHADDCGGRRGHAEHRALRGGLPRGRRAAGRGRFPRRPRPSRRPRRRPPPRSLLRTEAPAVGGAAGRRAKAPAARSRRRGLPPRPRRLPREPVACARGARREHRGRPGLAGRAGPGRLRGRPSRASRLAWPDRSPSPSPAASEPARARRSPRSGATAPPPSPATRSSIACCARIRSWGRRWSSASATRSSTRRARSTAPRSRRSSSPTARRSTGSSRCSIRSSSRSTWSGVSSSQPCRTRRR